MSEVLNIFKGMTTKKKGVTIKLIINEVAKYYQIPAEEIRGKSRKANIAIARHIVCYLSKELADVSLLEIAKELTKNHSTIISSISKIKKEKDLNENLNKALFDLRNNII
ncbi:MAG: hypothetical protein DRP42_00045 [Tenericutes bacterium]|nr:MAG: hypothetical protein DRP42_00045 [Mycoplasmatota bacterium]